MPALLTATGPLPGIWIAAATFVPTFLATFLGIAYLAGTPMAGIKGGSQPVMSALAPQKDLVATPGQAQEPTRDALGNAAVRPAPGPARPQVAPRATGSKGPTSAVTKDDAWVRAGAFPDRNSAERLATRLGHKGYPARVRRGDPPDTRWVVWVGNHPTGRMPSERRR